MIKANKDILILDGNSSQVLPLIRTFYKLGHRVSLVSPFMLSAGFFSRYAHKRLVWPNLYDDDNDTLSRLLIYLKNNRTDLVLGLGDKTAHLLSKNQKQLTQHTKIIVPDYDVFSIAEDKFNTMRFCMDNNIPCPLTFDGEYLEIDKVESLITFPVIVKPKRGVGSVGVFKYLDPELLKKDFKWIVTNFGSTIIQEYIPNEEQYTVEAFCNRESRVKACTVVAKSRFFPVSGGTSSCNVTVERPEIENVIVLFLEKLKWIGSANLDVIFDKRDNTPKIIEINPRVGAMVRIAFEAGVDIAELQLQLAFNSEVKDLREYNKGIVLRNLMLEFFWLLSNPIKNWRTTKPSFFHFFGKDIFYQAFRKDDPFPFLGLLYSSIRKYLNPEKFRKKFMKRNKS